MNKELCSVLRDRLLGLPFIDIAAGMAQTLTKNEANRDDLMTIYNKEPVAYDVRGSITCNPDGKTKEVSLIPNSKRKTIIYFEDNGAKVIDKRHGYSVYQSSVRLVCWMNRRNLVADTYMDIAARIEATIIDKLTASGPTNVAPFVSLMVNVAAIAPQDAAIFSRYTYKETDRQYLRPPFDFFALDLLCKFQVPAKCLDGINWDQQTCS